MKKFLIFWSLASVSSQLLSQPIWNKGYYTDSSPFLVEINGSLYYNGFGWPKFNKLGVTTYTVLMAQL